MIRFPSIRRCQGRGKRFSRLRGLSETLTKPVWERFPVERWAHRIAPPVEVVRRSLTLDFAGDPLRIAFLSDLHAGPTTALRIIEDSFAQALAAKPDVLLLGGDYVYYDADNIERLGDLLHDAARAVPTYGVWGNHDLWADDRYLARFFADAGVRMLCNEFERGLLGRHLHLYGVDDPWTGEPDFGPLAQADAPTLVLCHNPDGTLLLEPSHRVDLMLCGHTHGGQICRRDGSPFLVHAETGTKYAGGHYRLGESHLIVSRGVGMVEIPWRRFAAPEVTVIDLVPLRTAAIGA